MKRNTVKHTIRAGGTCWGTFVFEFASTGVAQIASLAGAEYIIFDMEHSGWGMDTMRMLLATSKSASAIPVVRVPATEYDFIARVLDLGALGIMVPMVENAEQAERIVKAAKYPPRGRRGTAVGVAHDDYEGGDVVAKLKRADEETLLIAQIETEGGLANVDAIAAVPGIDVLWIGLYDLTNFMGIPGQMDHPRVTEAIQQTVAAAKRHGKTPAVLVFSVEEGKQRLGQGFRLLAYSGDIGLYQQALAQGLRALSGSSQVR